MLDFLDGNHCSDIRDQIDNRDQRMTSAGERRRQNDGEDSLSPPSLPPPPCPLRAPLSLPTSSSSLFKKTNIAQANPKQSHAYTNSKQTHTQSIPTQSIPTQPHATTISDIPPSPHPDIARASISRPLRESDALHLQTATPQAFPSTHAIPCPHTYANPNRPQSSLVSESHH